MKKLLVAVLALSAMSAFAGGLIELTSTDGRQIENFKFDRSTNDLKNNEQSDMDLAFNYTYDINGQMMVGISYDSSSTSKDGDVDSSVTTGVHFFYNIDGKVNDTCYAGLRYLMTAETNDGGKASSNNTDGDAETTISLEYGHRFSLGKFAGVNWAWAPKFNYNMTTRVYDNSATDDLKSTEMTITPVNFNVIF